MLHENKPLYAHGLFWFVTLTPIAIAIIVAIPLMCGLQSSWSYEGYEFFTHHFKFPLWLTTFSAVFGVTVGRFHASKQRVKAIEQTETNNNFRNYFEHKKMFKELFPKKISGSASTSDNQLYNFSCGINPDALYELLFSKTSISHFSPTLKIDEGFVKAVEAKMWDEDLNGDMTDKLEEWGKRTSPAISTQGESLKYFDIKSKTILDVLILIELAQKASEVSQVIFQDTDCSSVITKLCNIYNQVQSEKRRVTRVHLKLNT